MRLEAEAPAADAVALNGEWRLLAAVGESAYRSSPFFWAFRQATSGTTSPIAIPGAKLSAGSPLASAVYGITDSIPFYDIGPVVQRISGVCSEATGCELPDETDLPDDAATEADATPSDGGYEPLDVSGVGSLQSVVQLEIGRLFGFPTAQSQMTTTAAVRSLPPSTDAPGAIDVELQIQTTAAKQSTISSLLPQLEDMLTFPSGDALEVVRARSSYVTLRTTYLSSTLRISRPVLQDRADDTGAVFVYARSS